MTFDEFFERVTRYSPHGWQARLALDGVCRNSLIRIPTGFGKTAGVVLAWLWNRVQEAHEEWPRRLVLCLPMRTLVEQTERAVKEWLTHASLAEQVHVHVLLGGLSPSDWHLAPEKNAVLIGTQDMLLSRALNRGYGSGRARWPMEYGLLNVDCLWVMDEIQLMDVGLATSAQLQGLACTDERNGKLPRPRRTWWMSATLQRDWLGRAPALHDVDSLPSIQLTQVEQSGPLWKLDKRVRIEQVPAATDSNAQRWAEIIGTAHKGGITLAVANTVKSALLVHAAIDKLRKAGRLPEGVDLRIVHSRFRGAERRSWVNEFLTREHCGPGKNRIIVATQVVEAGVDISADVLVSELAPWASLVQRFGRCARYGGNGQIIIIDRRHSDESAGKIKAKDDEERSRKRNDSDYQTARPYNLVEIEAAAEALRKLRGEASPAALEDFERSESARDADSLLPRLYPYAPLHVLSQRELLDLFDTGPDLTGADIDISRFVREGDERDVTVWWWPVPPDQVPHRRLRPLHDALCRIPVSDARNWLLSGRENTSGEEDDTDASTPKSKKARPRAWVWNYLDGGWEKVDERHIYPGQTILVDASAGGYSEVLGFTAKSAAPVVVDRSHVHGTDQAEAADSAEEQDDLSEGAGGSTCQYKTIATHAAEVAAEAYRLAVAFELPASIRKVMEVGGPIHDIGKAHPAFAGAIRDRNGIPESVLLAKAPEGRWHSVRHMYDHSHLGKRPGFRHELASALALLELMWRACPSHPALHGGREEILDLTVGRDLPDSGDRLLKMPEFLCEFLEFDEPSFNLALYLVLCHHGKVRATIPMSPRDQENPDGAGNLPIRGIRDGDELPAIVLEDANGREVEVPQIRISLDPARVGLSKRYGPSWIERVLMLREHYGVFQLGWLEALMRAADIKASLIAEPRDRRLPPDLVEVQPPSLSGDSTSDLDDWIRATLSNTTARQVRVGEPQKRQATRKAPSKRGRRGGA